jgi:phage gpG-like protein
MGVRGDFSALTDLRAKLRTVGEKKRTVLHVRLAAAGRDLIAHGFRESVDADDKPWLPLKSRVGKPLRKSGALANSFTSEATADGFKLGSNLEYAAVHQYGAQIAAHSRLRVELHFDKRGRFVAKGKRAVKSITTRATFGARGIPARPMLPNPGFGDRWKKAIEDRANAWVREHFEND